MSCDLVETDHKLLRAKEDIFSELREECSKSRFHIIEQTEGNASSRKPPKRACDHTLRKTSETRS